MYEVYVNIKGYEKTHQISNLGNVRSLTTYFVINKDTIITHKGKILKASISQGYLTVNLCRNNTIKRISLHRLLAIHFIPNPDNKPQVNHINGIKSDNRLSNLEWASQSENMIHSYNMGLHKKETLRKPVRQYTMEGKHVRDYASITIATEYTGIQGIGRVCSGERKSIGGYKWKYKLT